MVKETAKLTFGPGLSEFREGVNIPRMRADRAARMKQIMKQKGIPAVLVTNDRNVRYLVGFSWTEFMPFVSYALFFAEHDPVVFAHAGSYQQEPDQMPWIKEWRIARSWLSGICGPEAQKEEAALFAQGIRGELEARGLAKEKLGIIAFEDVARKALTAAGLTVVEAWDLLLEASKIKTQDEINCYKMAASICSSGWQRIIDVFRIGMSVGHLRREAMDAMLDAGAEVARCNIQSGPLSFERSVTYPLERRIENGDLLVIPECGTRYLGCPACLYRCFIAGRNPTAEEKAWYKRVKDSLDACMDASRIGNTTADAAKAFPPATKWGYKDEVEVLTVEIGHGVQTPVQAECFVGYGLPVINRQWSLKHPQPFEKGMVIAYETLEGKHRVGGARMENMVVVTDEGPELLDLFPRDELRAIG